MFVCVNVGREGGGCHTDKQHVLLWGVYDYYAALCDAYVQMRACVSVPLCLSVSFGILRATCFSLRERDSPKERVSQEILLERESLSLRERISLS